MAAHRRAAMSDHEDVDMANGDDRREDSRSPARWDVQDFEGTFFRQQEILLLSLGSFKCFFLEILVFLRGHE